MINTTASDNGGSDLSNALYWCSTENTLDLARFKNLSNNSGGTMHKSSALNVRAVRRF